MFIGGWGSRVNTLCLVFFCMVAFCSWFTMIPTVVESMSWCSLPAIRFRYVEAYLREEWV